MNVRESLTLEVLCRDTKDQRHKSFFRYLLAEERKANANNSSNSSEQRAIAIFINLTRQILEIHNATPGTYMFISGRDSILYNICINIWCQNINYEFTLLFPNSLFPKIFLPGLYDNSTIPYHPSHRKKINKPGMEYCYTNIVYNSYVLAHSSIEFVELSECLLNWLSSPIDEIATPPIDPITAPPIKEKTTKPTKPKMPPIDIAV